MRYLIYLLFAVSTSLSAGSIHKWVDEDGNVHYGDAPPTSSKTETVRVQSAPSDPGKALPRLNDDAAQEKAAADAAEQTAEEQNLARCENARADIDVMDNNAIIQLQESDGSVRNLSPAEIGERRSKAEADIRKYCN